MGRVGEVTVTSIGLPPVVDVGVTLVVIV